MDFCKRLGSENVVVMRNIALIVLFGCGICRSFHVTPSVISPTSLNQFNWQPQQRQQQREAPFRSLPYEAMQKSATSGSKRKRTRTTILHDSNFPGGSDGATRNDDDGTPDEEGANLAAEFFKMAQQKGIYEADASDYDEDEDDDEEDDDDDDDEEMNIPQGAINAFLGYDTGDVGDKLAGNVSLTDNQLYSEMKERVLDTAGGFVELVGKKSDDGEDEFGDDDENTPKPYVPPTTIPDSELTAGEVVLLVLDALLHNDVPTPNRGVEILFGYSSPGSQIKNEVGLTPTEYGNFLQETEYKVVFNHRGVSIDKGDYSFNGQKAFFTARLAVGESPLDVVSVNFILSAEGSSDDSCWMVESMLIRPKSMRRRRRR